MADFDYKEGHQDFIVISVFFFKFVFRFSFFILFFFLYHLYYFKFLKGGDLRFPKSLIIVSTIAQLNEKFYSFNHYINAQKTIIILYY